MAASDRLQLQVILQAVDKATSHLKTIRGASGGTARAIKEAKDQLKALDAVQRDAQGFRRTRIQLRQYTAELGEANAASERSKQALDEQRARHANLTGSVRAARIAYGQITQAYQDGRMQSADYTRQIELARITLLSSEQAHARSKASVEKLRASLKGATDRVSNLTRAVQGGQERLNGLKTKLDAAGVGTERLGVRSREMRAHMDAGNAAIKRQQEALSALAAKEAKLSAMRQQHGKHMAHVAMMAGSGVAGVATGRAIARPVLSTVQAYSQQEDAAMQLRASMMVADGSVPSELREISELAKRLGDRLPGTTADFYEMMTTLRKEGMSAKAILGGLGESAAFLGVQLRMPVDAAAQFAAKMQDATRASEGEMMDLMDTIQRTFYLGVDSSQMLAGFSKMSGVLNKVRKSGVDAARELAPLLVMMNQTGMEDGGSAGNAIRKVVDAGLDAKKLGKANDLLKSQKAGFSLNFLNDQGQYAGLDNLFAQLAKIKTIQNDMHRTSVMKTLFGDDAETHQVLETLMDKGLDGYREVVGKMQAQADLRRRVNEQLGTLKNVVEAAEGAGTNVLASIGETVAPDLKRLVGWLGEVSEAVGGWVSRNPELVAGIVKVVAVIAVLYAGFGALLVAVAGVLGPMFVTRFLLARVMMTAGPLAGLLKGALAPALAVAARGITALRTAAALFNPAALAAGLHVVRTAVMGMGAALLANPVTWIVLAIAGAALLIFKYWGPIKAFFGGMWDGLKQGLAPLGAAFSAAFAPMQPVFAALRPAWDWFAGVLGTVWAWVSQLLGPFQATQSQLLGAASAGQFFGQVLGTLITVAATLPQRFVTLGQDMVRGLISGIASMGGSLVEAINNMAGSAVGWFKEKLGIRSPSRVFALAGAEIPAGAALGIENGQARVRKAALALVGSTMLGLPTFAGAGDDAAPLRLRAFADASNEAAEPLRIDRRPPLAAPGFAAGAMVSGGDTINITINAAPGTDPAAIGRAVAAELDRRARDKRSRVLSSLGDID